MLHIQKTPTFWHIGASYLEQIWLQYPKSIHNLYSVPIIIVIEIQKGWSTRTKVIALKQLCLHMNNERPTT